jgi:thiol-disulfide isomerase/thioredoxin
MLKDLSENAPAGSVRDMILYFFVCLVIDKQPELYDSIPELKSFFSQTIIKEQLESLVNEKLGGAKKTIPVTEKTLKGISYLDNDSVIALSNIEVLPYLVEHYKNKTLYIDVWATWCGGCLIEMKHAPNLHKYFAGKEVVFINLCLDSPIEKWLKTINQNTIEGENYYLDADASKSFMGAYNISGFPTYMLIDRKGQISTAASPNNQYSAIQQIESCLH